MHDDAMEWCRRDRRPFDSTVSAWLELKHPNGEAKRIEAACADNLAELAEALATGLEDGR
jgi:hypothetical protein